MSFFFNPFNPEPLQNFSRRFPSGLFAYGPFGGFFPPNPFFPLSFDLFPPLLSFPSFRKLSSIASLGLFTLLVLFQYTVSRYFSCCVIFEGLFSFLFSAKTSGPPSKSHRKFFLLFFYTTLTMVSCGCPPSVNVPLFFKPIAF